MALFTVSAFAAIAGPDAVAFQRFRGAIANIDSAESIAMLRAMYPDAIEAPDGGPFVEDYPHFVFTFGDPAPDTNRVSFSFVTDEYGCAHSPIVTKGADGYHVPKALEQLSGLRFKPKRHNGKLAKAITSVGLTFVESGLVTICRRPTFCDQIEE